MASNSGDFSAARASPFVTAARAELNRTANLQLNSLTRQPATSLHFVQLNYTQSRAAQSRSLLPATSRHAQSWHRAPLGPMALYLFNVKTFALFCFPFR
jgi:hypothetical protein